MAIELLNKEKVDKENPIDMDNNLDRTILEEDKRMEDAYDLQERLKSNGGRKKDIREKIADFVKSQGYSHSQGKQEFSDETSDLFANGDILIEVIIINGMDREVIEQIMK